MAREDVEIINNILESYYEYCEKTLPGILRILPLGDSNKRVGIYGTGRHTKLMLTAYRTLIGPVNAKIKFISVDFDPFAEKYVEDDPVCIEQVPDINLDAIILSSSDYEEELYRSACRVFEKKGIDKPDIYRFYDKYSEDIFWQHKQLVRFPDRPFSELPILKFKIDDVFHWCRDIPLSCVMDKYRLQMSDEPDIYIFMWYGKEHLQFDYPCVRVAYWAGESHMPDWSECDYAVTARFIDDEPRHHRFNAMEPYNPMIQNRKRFLKDEMADRKFCNFIYSNETYGDGALLRKDFCTKLMDYKHVDCPGRVLNNMKDAISAREGIDWARGKV